MNAPMPSPAEAETVARIVADLRLAKAHYVTHHRSRHWDIFPEDFADRIADPAVWPDFRNNGLSSGFDLNARPAGETGPYIRTDAGFVASTARRHESLKTVIGLDFIAANAECEIGNPARVILDGVAVNPTDQRLIHDAWRVSTLLADRRDDRLRIADIGGGFGGALAKLKTLFPRAQAMLFDLPEVNAVQTWYLRRRFPEARFLTFSDHLADPGRLAGDDWDVAVLPGWAIADLPDLSVDLFSNTRSMMEMNSETIAFYFRHIQRAVRVGGMFYCVNRYLKSTVGEAIRIKDYPFDEQWMFRVFQTAWDQTGLHEVAAVRAPYPLAVSSRLAFRDLPPRRWCDAGRHLVGAGRVLKTKVLGDDPLITPGPHHRLRLAYRQARHHLTKAVVDSPLMRRWLRPPYRALKTFLKR